MKNYIKLLDEAKNIQDLFRVVKDMGREYFGDDHAGLMLGISDLGSYGKNFIGAFYSLNSNMIIVNDRPIKALNGTELLKPYLFHILLHEYIHSLGHLDEAETRQLAYIVSEKFFGKEHLATKMAEDIGRFVPELEYSEPEDISIDYVESVDKENMGYIG